MKESTYLPVAWERERKGRKDGRGGEREEVVIVGLDNEGDEGETQSANVFFMTVMDVK